MERMNQKKEEGEQKPHLEKGLGPSGNREVSEAQEGNKEESNTKSGRTGRGPTTWKINEHLEILF